LIGVILGLYSLEVAPEFMWKVEPRVRKSLRGLLEKLRRASLSRHSRSMAIRGLNPGAVS